MIDNLATVRGRGASSNPANRFEHIRLERDENWDPAEDPSPKTQFLRDLSQSIGPGQSPMADEPEPDGELR